MSGQVARREKEREKRCRQRMYVCLRVRVRVCLCVCLCVRVILHYRCLRTPVSLLRNRCHCSRRCLHSREERGAHTQRERGRERRAGGEGEPFLRFLGLDLPCVPFVSSSRPSHMIAECELLLHAA